MKIELDLDELYSEHWGQTPAEIVANEVEILIRNMIRGAIQDELDVARSQIQDIIGERIQRAVKLAAEEIDKLDDDTLLREVL